MEDHVFKAIFYTVTSLVTILVTGLGYFLKKHFSKLEAIEERILKSERESNSLVTTITVELQHLRGDIQLLRELVRNYNEIEARVRVVEHKVIALESKLS